MQKIHLTILTGASRGMGLAMAQQLLRPGSHLLCISRKHNSDLDASAMASGAVLEQWAQDLAEGAVAAQRLQDWLQQHPAAHFASATLINNAALMPRIAPLSATDPNDVMQVLRVGLEAPMLLTSAFLRATEAWSGTRKVLNISSGLGRRAMASQSLYCTSKAGMDQFTRCVALEEAHKPHGARVCALAPGVIDTDMQVSLRSTDATQFPDQSRFANLHANNQLTSPTEAAAQVLAWLERPDFGEQAVADVRDKPANTP